MSSKLRTSLLYTAIAALLVAVGYWNINPETLIGQPTAVVDEAEVDWYVENAHSVQYQIDGKLRYEMTAAKLEHHKATDITFMTMPDMQLYRGTPLPWHVTSDTGKVLPGGNQVELDKSVRIARTDEKDRPTVITSEHMTVFPQKQYAQTDQDVRIDAANGVTTARGMKAYLNDGKVFLLSNVRGQHEVR